MSTVWPECRPGLRIFSIRLKPSAAARVSVSWPATRNVICQRLTADSAGAHRTGWICVNWCEEPSAPALYVV